MNLIWLIPAEGSGNGMPANTYPDDSGRTLHTRGAAFCMLDWGRSAWMHPNYWCRASQKYFVLGASAWMCLHQLTLPLLQASLSRSLDLAVVARVRFLTSLQA